MSLESTDKSNWEKKLATYALAGGAVMFAANDAGATPIHFDGPVTIGKDQIINLDLDNNAVIDFQFQNQSDINGITGKDERVLDLITVTSGNSYVRDATNNPAALGPGETIDGTRLYGTVSPATMAGVKETFGSFGNWYGVSNAFLGLQFLDSASQTHFGWAQLSVSNSLDYTCAGPTGTAPCAATAMLIDWAYESEAGVGITTPGDPLTPVPEPASLTLLALGASGLATVRARRKRQQKNVAD